MRYIVEYKEDNYDDREQYLVRDTKRETVVARVQVGDFTGKIGLANMPTIEAWRAFHEAALLAIDMARLIAEKLEAAAENGEVA